MARQFQVERGAIPWKRIKLLGVVAVFLVVGISILRPDDKELQRLRSPDGTKEAVLSRYVYVQPHLRVRYGNAGGRMNVVFTSPAITNAFELLQPQLTWTGTPERLRLELQGQTVWEMR